MNNDYSEEQVEQLERIAYEGAMLEAGKEWERQRDEAAEAEQRLYEKIERYEKHIAELKAFTERLIAVGNALKREVYDAWERGGVSDFPATDEWENLCEEWEAIEENMEID